ncbi:MAG TPA: dephospho-CoA kinase [Candidatus Saccharimonadales bacterium]|nr:dephospho-CoA kinase [Candidatus Saccharimonadales bacterium]
MSVEIDPEIRMFELTGGMGAGKTTTGEIFESLGAKVIDTDKIATELQKPEGPALPPMVEILGAQIIGEDGKLDRALAGKIMFSDPELVKAINEALHPMVWDATLERIAELSAGSTAVIEVPVPDLEHAKIMNGIVSVITSEERAIERLVTGHRKIEMEVAKERIREQISNEERIAMSDFVIVNDGTFEELVANTTHVWEQMKTL